METGLYLYCVRLRTDEPLKVQRTIGAGKIQIIPYLDLEAVTSEVSIEEFSSAGIHKKAEEDLDWIKSKAQIHEEVIELAMKTDEFSVIPVIPMQFGVIFRTREKLKETLYENLEKFRESLKFLEGREEWGVKVFLDEKVFEDYLEQGNEELLVQKREAQELPKGLAFFAKKKAAYKIEEIKQRELDKITREIIESLANSAVTILKAKILDKDFTLLSNEMILNGFYLLEEKRLTEFMDKTEDLKKRLNPLGIDIEISGPWPSYHFA